MTVRASVRELETPAGMARAHLLRPTRLRGSVVLGHGAGGGIEAPDLVELTGLTEDGWLVVRVEQPWRVAGKKVATPPKTLDTGWLAVLAALTQGRWALPRPLVCGGRSAGARVACRTAAATGARAVLCLAFPEHPPGKPEKTRMPELDGVDVPVLVVQGRSDPFGVPEPGPDREVVVLAGDHSLRSDSAGVETAVTEWLEKLLAG